MSKIILVILLLGGIIFWWHWNSTPDPLQRKKLLQKTIIGTVIIICLLMVVTGRLNWLWAAFVGLLATIRQMLPTLLRYFPMITQFYRAHAPKASAQNASTVTTKYIEMTLDHQTGKLSGKVLSGDFKDKTLEELDRDQLKALFDFCNANDINSARLLENYLTDRFGEDNAYTAGTGEGKSGGLDNNMSVAEALQILGLDKDPSNEEITKSYRKIMQQLHPDRGGNQYFAAKANEARKVLLNKFG
jgi:hypothetical protein